MAIINQAPVYPGWQTVKAIGSGSYGTVYEIQRDVYGNTEKAALKVITLPFSDSEVDYLRSSGMDDEKITRTIHAQVGGIANEYKLMSQIRDCPNVVRCDDFLERKHRDAIGWDIYIKMELLTPLLKRTDLISSEQQIIKLGKDLCRALMACQEHNIIHRDIKPQNIFVSPKGEFKLGDFGIARNMDRTTNATVGMGTYSYMAPEVARGQAYGRTADIYSLGLVLYWCLNNRQGPFLSLGRIPTHEDNENAKNRRFAGEPLPAPANGSDMLKQIALKACAFDPRTRYQSAAELLNALNTLETQLVYHGQSQQTADSFDDSTVRVRQATKSVYTANIQNQPASRSKKKTFPIILCLLLILALITVFFTIVLPMLSSEDTQSETSDAPTHKEEPTVQEDPTSEDTVHTTTPTPEPTVPVRDTVVTEQELKTALENSNYAKLGADIQLTSDVVVNGDTLDGNGYALTSPNYNSDDFTTENGLTISGGTVENVTVTGNYRAIGDRKDMGANNDVRLKNVTIDGGNSYALNFGYGNGQASLYVEDSTLLGWTSFTKLKNAQFTNCTFGWSNNGTQGNLRPYIDTTLIGCTFREYVNNGETKPYNLAFKSGTSGITLTLKDCYYEDALITYDNIYDLLNISLYDNTIVIQNTEDSNNEFTPFIGTWLPDDSNGDRICIYSDGTWAYIDATSTHISSGIYSYNYEENALELYTLNNELAITATSKATDTISIYVMLEALIDHISTNTFVKAPNNSM